MIALFLQIALLAGVNTSHGMGENGVAPIVAVQATANKLQFEGIWSDLNKYTGSGWYAKGAVDVWFEDLSIGWGITHRNGGPWAKDVWWARAGARGGPLRFVAEVAPVSRNREVKLEARLTIRSGWLVLEPRYFVEYHSQVTDRYGQGFSLLAGGIW